MPVNVISTIKPKNNGTFPVVEDIDVLIKASGARLSEVVATMATQTDIETLQAAINGKASQSDLESLSTTVSGKASQADLTALSNTVSTKAAASDLAETNAAVALKANQSDLEATNTTVAAKANASDVTASVNSLQAQIDALVTPVTQDAEVEAARVGADGKSYASLKSRLDAEQNKLNTEITYIEQDIDDFSDTIYPENLYNQAAATDGVRLQSNGATYSTESYFTSDYIDISFVGNKKLYLGTGQYALNFQYVVFYDENKNVTSYSSSVANNIDNDITAKYMRFSAEATYYPLNRNVGLYVGERKNYTAYTRPYHVIPTDQEIVNARTNSSGKTYANLKSRLDAADSVTSELHDEVYDYLGSVIYPQNIYDQSAATNGVRLQANGNTYETEDYYTSGYVDVSFCGEVNLYFGTGKYGVNAAGVAFYDDEKQLIEWISTETNNVPNNTLAKYMRFSMSATYYPLDRDVHVSYGSARAADYTPYFAPHLSRFDDAFFTKISKCNDYLLTGYGNSGSMPVFDFSQGSKVRVTVGHIITLTSALTGNTQVTRYNSNPATFELTANKTLVFDRADLQLKVIDNTDYPDSDEYIILLVTGQTGQLYGGMWFGCAMWQMVGADYREKRLPYSPRSFTSSANADAGDQSMCVLGDWLICMDGEDSDGFMKILNKSTKERIKLITHTLGHANNISYCAKTDSLLISSTTVSYILEDATSFIENNDTVSPSDCVTISDNAGVFVTDNETISCTQGTYDTIKNTTFTSISLEYLNGHYTGNIVKGKTYTDYYRMPVAQDMKWYDGSLYLSCGYNKSVVYKIKVYENNTFEVVDSYNIYSSTYEQEGIAIDSGNILLSMRETGDLTKKYIVTMTL